MKNIKEEITLNDRFNLVEILSVDHTYLKECICILLTEDVHEKERLFYARTFLDTLEKYTSAIEKTVYDSLIDMEELHDQVIEQIIKCTLLSSSAGKMLEYINQFKILDDISYAKLKKLARQVDYFITRENEYFLPQVQVTLNHEILNEMGFQYMILRQFTPHELENYPFLQKEIYYSVHGAKRNIYQWSGDFIKKVNGYIGSLVSQSTYFIKS